MKLKALSLGAAIALTAFIAHAVDVYSVNIVGYHKRTIPPGFSLLANQVNATNNSISALFPAPLVGTKIFKWNGSGFDTYEFLGSPFNTWFPNGNATLTPGEGAFYFNPGGTLTNIFAGEVEIGALTNSLPAGFSITSSQLPQAGMLTADLQLPAVPGDKVFKYNGSTYDTYEFLGSPFNTWFPGDPPVAVGDSFWVFKGSSTDWVRNFSP